MNKNVWYQQGNDYIPGEEITYSKEKLPIGVYEIRVNPMTGATYLHQIYDKFQFPYKVYGLERKFIDWVLKSYKNTNKNLGVLLNGIKGTGKTVTAEILANELELPIIIVERPMGGLTSFLNSIQQDVTLFFDEFEKNFSAKDEDGEHDDSRSADGHLLTIMDGVLGNGFKKVFLLTTNQRHINDNLIGRPGRLRYAKQFENLKLEVIFEIVDDILEKPEFRAVIIEYVSKLEIITIDIVKAIVNEVNVHDAKPEEFKDFFNVPISEELCNVLSLPNRKKTSISDNAAKRKSRRGAKVIVQNEVVSASNSEMPVLTKLRFKEVNVEPKYFTKEDVGNWVTINGGREYEILEVIDFNTIEIKDTDRWDQVTGKHLTDVWKIERTQPRHAAFNKFTF